MTCNLCVYWPSRHYNNLLVLNRALANNLSNSERSSLGKKGIPHLPRKTEQITTPNRRVDTTEHNVQGLGTYITAVCNISFTKFLASLLLIHRTYYTNVLYLWLPPLPWTTVFRKRKIILCDVDYNVRQIIHSLSSHVRWCSSTSASSHHIRCQVMLDDVHPPLLLLITFTVKSC